jgi:hypothetical protein
LQIILAIVAMIPLNAPAQLASGYAELGPPPRLVQPDLVLSEREAETAALASATGLSVDTTDRATVVAFFNQNHRPSDAIAIG